jgi:hypothetical protein
MPPVDFGLVLVWFGLVWFGFFFFFSPSKLGLGFGFVFLLILGVVLDPVLETYSLGNLWFQLQKLQKTLKPLQKKSQFFWEILEHNPANKKELK